MVEQNEEKKLIILQCCEFKIYLIQIEINNEDYALNLKSKTGYPLKDLNFNPCSILPLRAFRKDDYKLNEKKIFSKFFLISSQTNIKLLKYNEEGDIVLICNVKFEDEESQKLVEKNHISRMEQLDEGIISVHLNKTKLNCYLFLKEKK